MDEPTDPVARQMALTALTTEHFNLQTARIGTISPSSPFQGFLTTASMVACINSIVGGVAMALTVRSLLDSTVQVAVVTGGLVALAFAALFMMHGVRRFLRAAAVAPELYAWEGSGAVSWSEQIRGKGR